LTVQTQSPARHATRLTLALAAIAGLILAAFYAASPVLGTHVTPTPISSGNPTCGVFDDAAGQTWTELKVENPSNGVFTDGTLTVTITNFVNSSSGTPGSFDWSSNIGVDAVFVKAGTDKHNLYVYNPEATSDTGLGPQSGTGNGISHISFCYDFEPPPSVPASVPASVPGSVEGSVGGGTGTPAASLPNTALGLAGSGPLATIFFGAVLIASLGALAYANVAAVRRRR